VYYKRKTEIAEGKYLDVKKENDLLFEVFAEEYLNLHSKVNNRAWKDNDARSIRVLTKTFGGKMLSEITPFVVEKYKQKLMERLMPATVNRYLACLQSMYNKAIAWERFSGGNPVARVKKLKENNARTRFLTAEEIKRLLDNSTEHLRVIIMVAVSTGMRSGEIFSLKWEAMDFERGFIYLTQTKNGERREVPLNEHAKRELMAYPRHASSPYVFCNSDGSFIKSVKGSFSTALEKAKIANFRFHDLRHTAASHLVMSGAELNTVREILGHKSMQMTMRYSHLTADHKKQAVDLLSRRLDTVLSPHRRQTFEVLQSSVYPPDKSTG
jgi:integrase